MLYFSSLSSQATAGPPWDLSYCEAFLHTGNGAAWLLSALRNSSNRRNGLPWPEGDTGSGPWKTLEFPKPKTVSEINIVHFFLQ